jgi:hypothetical protein
MGGPAGAFRTAFSSRKRVRSLNAHNAKLTAYISRHIQAALTPNFMYVTAEQAKHLAFVISECRKRDVRTVEPTQEAEDSWCETIVKSTADKSLFYAECTPSYNNNEGKPSMAAARNATYGFGPAAFFKLLAGWREAGDLAGLDVRCNAQKGE